MISASLKALRLNNDFDVVLVNQLSPVMMAVPAIIYKKEQKEAYNILFGFMAREFICWRNKREVTNL